MKNILRISRNDLRKITGSVVAIITILGLCIIPCLYAWFNIFSNWAPYESDATGRISVAVANMDMGSSAAGLKINVGDKIVEALEANNDIGWEIVDDEEAAKEGVYSGAYYAALVLPENFTVDVLSFTKGDLENPKIIYYENEKKNAIAPKITGKAKTALQEEVNAAFVETIAGYATDAASVAEANGIDPAEMMADLSDRLDDLSGDVSDCIALADSAAGLTEAAGNLLEVSGSFIGSTHDVFAANDELLEGAEDELEKIKKPEKKDLSKAVKDVKDTTESLETLETEVKELLSLSDAAYELFLKDSRDDMVSRVNKMKRRSDEQSELVKNEGFTALGEKFDELSETLDGISAELSSLNKDMGYAERKAIFEKIGEDTDKASEQADDILAQINKDIDTNISTALANAKTSLAGFRRMMSGADKDLSSLSKSISSYDSSLSSLKSSIDTTSENLMALRVGASSVADLLNDVAGNDLLRELRSLMANDEAAVAEYLANPIRMKTEVIWPISTYGSAMAPFYTVLAQWVGALLTAVLIKVKLKRKDELHDLKLHEWFFGRFGLFLLIGLAQALIVSLGDLLYIGIQCTAPLRFVLTACINGIVFMMINYALVFALDNIGLGAGVIILVLQVAGSGGTYPVEVLPGIFKMLYPFMPFRYAMDAMRECIGGMYDGTYWRCTGVLLLFALFSIVFGLALYMPARRLNETIAASKAKSEIML